MSPYEVVFNQKPRKPTKLKLGTSTGEMKNCNPTETSACNTQPTHTHLEKNLVARKLQNFRKEHLPNGSLTKKNTTMKHIKR